MEELLKAMLRKIAVNPSSGNSILSTVKGSRIVMEVRVGQKQHAMKVPVPISRNDWRHPVEARVTPSGIDTMAPSC